MSPTSLDSTIVATEASTQPPCLPLVPLADIQLKKTKPPRRNTTPGCRQRLITRIEGFPRNCTIDLSERDAPAKQRCLQESQRRPQPPPSLVQHRTETGFSPNCTPSSHRRRQAHQSPQGTCPPGEAPPSAADYRRMGTPPGAQPHLTAHLQGRPNRPPSPPAAMADQRPERRSAFSSIAQTTLPLHAIARHQQQRPAPPPRRHQLLLDSPSSSSPLKPIGPCASPDELPPRARQVDAAPRQIRRQDSSRAPHLAAGSRTTLRHCPSPPTRLPFRRTAIAPTSRSPPREHRATLDHLRRRGSRHRRGRGRRRQRLGRPEGEG
jgi:hypothetical protein